MSLLVLERGMDGFERGRNLDKVGLHAQDTAELFFTDVHVPVGNLLGVEGKGFAHLVDNLPQERLSIAVGGVAAAEAAFRWTLDYVKQRTAFGSPIASFQNTQFELAEMRTEIDVTQVFVDRCVDALERRVSSRWRRPRRRSGGAPSCRSAPSTGACSCTVATATCSSTRSRARISTHASPPSTAAPRRS